MRIRDEEGQIILPLLVFVLVMGGVAIGMFGFGEASDSRGKAQKAADAAALGAGVSARDGYVSSILTSAGGAVFHGQWSGLAGITAPQAVGCVSARGWAARNDSSLTSCTFRPNGRFDVRATSEASPERNLRGQAQAAAEINVPSCSARIYTTGTVTFEEVTCRGNSATAMIVYNVTTAYTPVSGALLPDVWKRLFKVRLVE